MDNTNVIKEVFQAFQDLMVKLNLEDNIIGYTLCLLFLSIVLAVKILTICCVLKKVKNCKTASSLDQIDNLQISEII